MSSTGGVDVSITNGSRYEPAVMRGAGVVASSIAPVASFCSSEIVHLDVELIVGLFLLSPKLLVVLGL